VELTFSEQIHVPTRAEVIESLRESKAIVKFRNFVRIDTLSQTLSQTLSIENIKLEASNRERDTSDFVEYLGELFNCSRGTITSIHILGLLDVSEEM
jgi:hypothetical protein